MACREEFRLSVCWTRTPGPLQVAKDSDSEEGGEDCVVGWWMSGRQIRARALVRERVTLVVAPRTGMGPVEGHGHSGPPAGAGCGHPSLVAAIGRLLRPAPSVSGGRHLSRASVAAICLRFAGCCHRSRPARAGRPRLHLGAGWPGVRRRGAARGGAAGRRGCAGVSVRLALPPRRAPPRARLLIATIASAHGNESIRLHCVWLI